MHQKMTKILEEQLKDLSFHKLSRNGFDGIVMGSNAKYCQFGMISPDILHLLWIGLCNHLWKSFNEELSWEMRRKLYLVSINTVIRLLRQNIENLPAVSCFRNGITNRKRMRTGKENLARIFFLYTCFLDTDFVEGLNKWKRGKNKKYNIPEFVWSRPKVKEWFKLLCWTMCLNAWISSPDHDRNMFKSSIDETDNNMASTANLNKWRNYSSIV